MLSAYVHRYTVSKGVVALKDLDGGVESLVLAHALVLGLGGLVMLVNRCCTITTLSIANTT